MTQGSMHAMHSINQATFPALLAVSRELLVCSKPYTFFAFNISPENFCMKRVDWGAGCYSTQRASEDQ